MKKFPLIAVIMAIGSTFTATASPNIEKKDYPAAFADVGYTATTLYVNAVDPVLISNYSETIVDVVALMPVSTSYSKKKFVSHNSRLNRQRLLFYGSSAKQKEDKQEKDTAISLKLYSGDDIEKPAWQIIASLTKLEA